MMTHSRSVERFVGPPIGGPSWGARYANRDDGHASLSREGEPCTGTATLARGHRGQCCPHARGKSLPVVKGRIGAGASTSQCLLPSGVPEGVKALMPREVHGLRLRVPRSRPGWSAGSSLSQGRARSHGAPAKLISRRATLSASIAAWTFCLEPRLLHTTPSVQFPNQQLEHLLSCH